MRGSRILRSASFGLAVALALAVPPAVARVLPEAGPGVSVDLFPEATGQDGWFVTPPEVHVTVDADAELGWGWDSIATSVTVGANVSRYVSDAPEGVHVFRYNAVSSGGSTAGAVQVKTDSVEPSRPEGFSAEGFAGPGVVLNWNVCTDGTSGVDRYDVYRDTDGPPYTYLDHVASTSALTYTESGHVTVWRNGGGVTTLTWEPVTGEYRYAVRAVDRAGNESLLTEATLTGGAFHDLVLLRSSNGSDFSRVETLPVDATAYTDTSAPPGTTVYVLRGVDADGNVLAESTLAPVVDDLIAPLAPTPALQPVYSPGGLARFRLTWPLWAPIADAGSGVLSATLTHGPAGEPGIGVVPTGAPFDIAATTPTAVWSARVRTEDVAGNVAYSGQAIARNVGTTRISDRNRVLTSLALARAAFVTTDTAVFASSLDFPDALAAASLAGAVHGPVILVGRGVLPPETVATLQHLGIRTGYVVGGTGAVEAATFASIDRALPGSLTRIFGRDRFATAAAVSRATASIAGPRGAAFVVSGKSFADALSVGPAAYAAARPILFATSTTVPASTLAALRGLSVKSTLIVGGAGAVTASAERTLRPYGPSRVAGRTRYETSVKFADRAIADGILGPASPVVATALAFPDGLSAASLGGELRGPVLLTSPASPAAARTWLAQRRAGLDLVRFVGGSAVMPESLRVGIWTAVSKP